jgi:hypothetical protein
LLSFLQLFWNNLPASWHLLYTNNLRRISIATVFGMRYSLCCHCYGQLLFFRGWKNNQSTAGDLFHWREYKRSMAVRYSYKGAFLNIGILK